MRNSIWRSYALVIEHQLLDSARINGHDTACNFSDIASANLSVVHLIRAVPSAVTANKNALHNRSHVD
jgi:hypothetical protein